MNEYSKRVNKSAGQTVRRFVLSMAAAFALCATVTHGQGLLLDRPVRPAMKPAAVEYLYPAQIALPAGKPTTVALHFRIAPGRHINSHTPSEEGLIPTVFSIPEGSGVRLDGAIYPPGKQFTLPVDPTTQLSVYTDEFIVRARIVATAGNHLVEAKLRYQACDTNSCSPPRTITATIDVTGN